MEPDETNNVYGERYIGRGKKTQNVEEKYEKKYKKNKKNRNKWERGQERVEEEYDKVTTKYETYVKRAKYSTVSSKYQKILDYVCGIMYNHKRETVLKYLLKNNYDPDITSYELLRDVPPDKPVQSAEVNVYKYEKLTSFVMGNELLNDMLSASENGYQLNGNYFYELFKEIQVMICAEKEDLSFNSIEFEAFMKDLSEGQQAVLIAYGNDKPSEYNPWEHDEDLHKEVQGFIMKCLERYKGLRKRQFYDFPTASTSSVTQTKLTNQRG